MSKKYYVIYIPGLGDRKVKGQQKAVNVWRRHRGITPYIFQMRWDDGEAFQPKLDRLLSRIDQANVDGYEVSLVAASAGASAALNAYSQRRDVIHGVVCICGQILGPNHISAYTYKTNPAFKESMQMLPDSLEALGSDDRRRILSLHPIKDLLVPVEDTYLAGAVLRRMPTSGHAFSIGYALTVGSSKIMRFLRSVKL